MSQNLSPFYAELIDFIHRDVSMRITVDGYDESADPELKAFQKSLADAAAPTSQNDQLPLSEIVENYQYLFGARGPLHLEKN